MDWSRQLSQRERILLLVLVILLLLSVYYFFVFRPVNDAIDAANLQAENLELDLQVLEAKRERFDLMTAELADLKANGNAVVVPEYDNLQQLMGFLNSVFTGTIKYNLNIQGIQQTADSAGGVVRRTMDMSFVSPSYGDARVAVERLQSSPYCCQLTNLSIEPSNTAESNSILGGSVQVKLTITFFETLLQQ